jgi:hypothetical protein
MRLWRLRLVVLQDIASHLRGIEARSALKTGKALEDSETRGVDEQYGDNKKQRG